MTVSADTAELVHFADPQEDSIAYWHHLPPSFDRYAELTFDWGIVEDRLTEIDVVCRHAGWDGGKAASVAGDIMETALFLVRFFKELDFYPPYLTVHRTGRVCFNWCYYGDLSDEELDTTFTPQEISYLEIEIRPNSYIDLTLMEEGKILNSVMYDVATLHSSTVTSPLKQKTEGVRAFIDTMLDMPLTFVKPESSGE